MIYKSFQGESLSALGMGTMRLPVKNDAIDQKMAEEMFAYAIDHGVNYFDTAWGYHNGTSETVTGNILSAYPRDSFYLASKFPGYDLSNMDKVEEIFEKQLEKCRVDYFDFYLVHNVCELNINAYLDETHGIRAYLKEQKKNGRIRHLGFSCHGNCEITQRFLDAYGEDMEFGQLQTNYVDWTFQNAKGNVELLRSVGLPVWVMEPLRGGKLSNIPEELFAPLRQLRPGVTPSEWAFRFLQSQPGITVTLSGMSNPEQLKENIATFETEKPLNEKETAALMQMAKDLMQNMVPCTACRYCTSYCPKELNIPWLLNLYNEHIFAGGGFLAPMALNSVPEEKRPRACIGCRSCGGGCPQKIKIADHMADFVEKL